MKPLRPLAPTVPQGIPPPVDVPDATEAELATPSMRQAMHKMSLTIAAQQKRLRKAMKKN